MFINVRLNCKSLSDVSPIPVVRQKWIAGLIRSGPVETDSPVNSGSRAWSDSGNRPTSRRCRKSDLTAKLPSPCTSSPVIPSRNFGRTSDRPSRNRRPTGDTRPQRGVGCAQHSVHVGDNSCRVASHCAGQCNDAANLSGRKGQ
jgi:hypothetical protein